MQTSEVPQSSSSLLQKLYHKRPKQQVDGQCYTTFQGEKNAFLVDNEQFFTLDSSTASDCVAYDSPTTVSSNWSAFSPHCSHSYVSDCNTSGSPLSGSSGVVDDSNEMRHALRELENKLLGPGSEVDDDTGSCSFTYLPDSKRALSDVVSKPFSSSLTRWTKIVEIAPNLETKELLTICAEAVSDADVSTAELLMGVLERRVSVSGEPLQRLSAYMLEGLRARLLSSGSTIYKKLNCNEPTGSELMSYMQVMYHICPYYKFAYVSANVVIQEAVSNENRIHIIDFQIAQGSQWMFLIKALSQRPGGPPFIRVTGVDDPQSIQARGGGLRLVSERLAKFAESYGVPFKFHAAAISGSEVELENLHVVPGEVLAVNFPYSLHHMPDESVTTVNHRDRLLRLVKSLSPRVVTLVEQEANTNSAPFLLRFRETLDYYAAMFESIDAARPRDDKQRISAEEHCVARDVVNLVACEGGDRVERHEVFGKWMMRLMMAGFSPCPLSASVGQAMRQVLSEYSPNYWLQETNGALCLGWKGRALATFSAWR
ncbi:unnamed protein product [Cuscuta europaea]|uniref:Scarecrow-like protein 13 n=1 Tax=Cuscuta europaea TaxID=41803 RepID=A0A9P1E832_CUSEU|nr:unnamed protein product [Cuscuta europaea]